MSPSDVLAVLTAVASQLAAAIDAAQPATITITISPATLSTLSIVTLPVKVRPPPAKSAAVWEAYRLAYSNRYGVEPLRNRIVNSQLAAFVDRVGSASGPGVVTHYLRSNRGLYVAAKHPTGLLVRDAEALHTEWATGTYGTDTAARLTDQTAERCDGWTRLIEEARSHEHHQ